MFLSKVSVMSSGHSANELIKLSNNGAYASHQLLWKLFSDQTERNFLYREESTETGLPNFYVLSQTTPSSDDPLFNVRTKSFAPKLMKGSRLAFKLRINPTICVKNENGKSKRHDVLMHAKYQAVEQGELNKEKVKQLMNEAAQRWFCDTERLERWGFKLDAVPDIECYTQHRSRKKNHNVQFSSVDFQGIMTIEEPERFLEAYSKGFGRAKAMGCGLMMIRPI